MFTKSEVDEGVFKTQNTKCRTMCILSMLPHPDPFSSHNHVFRITYNTLLPGPDPGGGVVGVATPPFALTS